MRLSARGGCGRAVMGVLGGGARSSRGARSRRRSVPALTVKPVLIIQASEFRMPSDFLSDSKTLKNLHARICSATF